MLIMMPDLETAAERVSGTGVWRVAMLAC